MTKKVRSRSSINRRNRERGAAFEREVSHVFQTYLGRDVSRNLGQARDGGNDITVGPLVAECKRRTVLGSLPTWMAQAEAATTRENGQLPVVIARADHGTPFVTMHLTDFLEFVTRAIIRGTAVWD